MSFRTFLRQLDQRRRSTSFGVERFFYRFLGQDRYLIKEHLPHDAIQKILVVRNNKRIGNMYFMLPFLHELRKAYPKAKIDLLIISSVQEQIFRHLGLNNILVSHFSFKTILNCFKAIRAHRKTIYDLLLMPHGSDTDTIVGGLMHARNKVAFYNELTNLVFPHSVAVNPGSSHAALGCLKLLEALGNIPNPRVNHTMVFSPEEKARGLQISKTLRGNSHYCFAYFRGARGTKVIPNQYWSNFRERFDDASGGSIKWIEILSPDVRKPLAENTECFESSDLRHLAAVLCGFDLFISGDTGPLHLADAADVRCIGLFTTTNPTQFGCLGPKSINVTDLERFDPKNILSSLQQGS